MNEYTDKIHEYWYQFCEHFSKMFYNEENGIEYDDNGIPIGEVVYQAFDSSKMVGYDAMLAVEEYAETHPEIMLVGCDDDYFTGSLLVLVPHPKMGITVIYIPQNGKDNEFFLYPGHIEHLQNALNEFKSKHL